MERSVIRDKPSSDYVTLHPGYKPDLFRQGLCLLSIAGAIQKTLPFSPIPIADAIRLPAFG